MISLDTLCVVKVWLSLSRGLLLHFHVGGQPEVASASVLLFDFFLATGTIASTICRQRLCCAVLCHQRMRRKESAYFYLLVVLEQVHL